MSGRDGLDVIGDVHGEYDALTRLLTDLGYASKGGAWRHPSRTAVFVGDLIDRGPQQVEVVNLVRSMRDAGTALVAMGNHEWNAIAWVTEDPSKLGSFLRDVKKRSQHKEFLEQVVEGSDLHREFVDWFKTLPLWLDLPGLRVIHACWQPSHVQHVRSRIDTSAPITNDFLVDAHVKGSADHTAIETLLKGIEVELPSPMTFVDKGGTIRHEARIQWWREPPRTFRNSAIVDGDEVRAQLPEIELPASVIVSDDDDPRPVIFGHYWAKGTPTLQSKRATCVDYSATMGGSLVAYRWSGESELDAANFVAVPGSSAR